VAGLYTIRVTVRQDHTQIYEPSLNGRVLPSGILKHVAILVNWRFGEACLHLNIDGRISLLCPPCQLLLCFTFEPWRWRRQATSKRPLTWRRTASLRSYVLREESIIWELSSHSVVFSPQANYTDWATSSCWRNLVPTFADIDVSRGQRGESPRSLISVFYTGAANFLSSSSSFILTRAEWTLFQTNCNSENLAAPWIEPGTSASAARKSNH
jgi:hypothetical protein